MNHGSKRHPSRCHGVTSLEYVILVALIAVAVAGALTEFEVEVPQFFQKVAYSLGAAPAPGDGDGGGTPGDGHPGDGGSDPGTGDPGSGDPGSGDPGSGDPGSGDPGSGGDGGGETPPGGDNPGGGGPGGSDGGSGGGNDFVPDYEFSRVIPYYWNDHYRDWFPRPSGIPEDQWHDQPYTISSNGDAVVGNNGNKPNEMGWHGVELSFTTPAPGQTLKVQLTVGQNKILYTFTRATSP
nr:hypothetical protein [Pseudomonas sp.]